MILKYSIYESIYNDYIEKHHSIGEWVESVSLGNDYLLKIVSNYINNYSTDIRISNAVNLLNNFDKKQLFYRIFNYLKKGESNKKPNVMTNVYVNESLGGKNIFKTFLKCSTALKSTFNKEIKNGYLFYYKTQNFDNNSVKLIFSRFISMSSYLNLISSSNFLYYGITYDLKFEYGICNTNCFKIGTFPINVSTKRWILSLKSPSSKILKSDLLPIDVSEMLIFSKIVSVIDKFNINPSKYKIYIKDNILTYSCYGIGKWEGSDMDLQSKENIKKSFNSFLLKQKWCDKILFNLTHHDYWVNFNIKIK